MSRLAEPKSQKIVLHAPHAFYYISFPCASKLDAGEIIGVNTDSCKKLAFKATSETGHKGNS